MGPRKLIIIINIGILSIYQLFGNILYINCTSIISLLHCWLFYHIGSSLYRLHSNGLGEVDIQRRPDRYSASDTSTNSYKLKVTKLVFVLLRFVYYIAQYTNHFRSQVQRCLWQQCENPYGTLVCRKTERKGRHLCGMFRFILFFYKINRFRVLHILTTQNYGI